MIRRFPILAERLATFWALVLKEVQGLELVPREVVERVFFQRLAFPPPSMRVCLPFRFDEYLLREYLLRLPRSSPLVKMTAVLARLEVAYQPDL
jgi:hypothetical protein